MESLPAYLKKRAARSLRYLREQTQDLTQEQALRFRSNQWPDQPWGIGQNGSIAGIVYHVTAWKQTTLPLFAPGGTITGRENFDAANAPDAADWTGLVSWLERVGAEWQARLDALPDEAFDETRVWAGVTITLANYVSEMLEHDIQHAAQIEYLRQRMKAETD